MCGQLWKRKVISSHQSRRKRAGHQPESRFSWWPPRPPHLGCMRYYRRCSCLTPNWTWPLSISQHQHPFRVHMDHTCRWRDEYLLVEDDKRRSNSSSAHLNIFAFATTDDRIAHRTGQPTCNVRADFRLTAPPIPALRTASEINGYRNGGLHIPTRQDPCPPRQEPKEACSNVAFPSLRGQTSAAQACGVHGGVALQSSGPRLEVVVSKQPSGMYQLDGGVAAVIVARPNRP